MKIVPSRRVQLLHAACRRHQWRFPALVNQALQKDSSSVSVMIQTVFWYLQAQQTNRVHPYRLSYKP